MGQKINPNGFRLGVIRDWESKWYADRGYKETLNEDLRIRKFIDKKLKNASVSTVEIERAANRINVSINTSKPGMVIGKGGSEVEALRKELNALTKKQVHVNIVEIKKPDLDAKLVAESIASQLEARIAFRRATRQATQRTMRAGAKGIRVQTSGRLNGADMARREWHTEGRVPLQTLRADIDYAWVNAFTTYGEIGVQVWINRGEILPSKSKKPEKAAKGGNK
ncbi:30S ribosomal protein S3 [Lactobacillus helsingborgensis]|uniref:Small ribosomal subunit protein uS3 n=1 Tax=Lactobacillus helsingborgensis TaxID=1218494 RepID=A0A0F4LYQ4_9LACO|nr:MULTISPECIES: 30S ribosomal protein S3 [Lactobacillus]MEB3362722.1 30S ribosomal protein S3 [Lactobacillus sp. R2/2]AIS09655.1 SSU ribosomal protein S3p (S3e) [Lactobacillus sp. wkB8]AWN33873.1 30S ribosomal protein S3 [Lactobacillus helsingborgensis]KJY63458.1 30S ribosomal protein S3 [Lactobacillus helsingborgensis]MBC6357162.1 30S ribosomal protein S3 [Lactobacillus helsingborgensis]